MKRRHPSRPLLVASAGLLAVIASLGAPAAAQAIPRTIVVSPTSGYPTIQSGVDAAADGDTVQISDGVYAENVTIDGKYVSLQGNPDQVGVVLHAPAGRTPIMIQHVPYRPDLRVRVSGLRVESGSSPSGQGGGLTIAFDASPEIADNTFTDNYSSEQGGAILVYDHSDPLIRNNTIVDNRAVQFGGGIFVVGYSSPTIANNLLAGNTVAGASIPNGGSSGGAIYLENDVTTPSARVRPVVFGNTIRGNSAEFAGGGIMVRVGVDAIVEANTIELNTASYGGGIHLESEGSSIRVAQNTIRANSAVAAARFAGSGYGGGISVYAGSIPEISANTITGNTATSGGAGIVVAESADATITANYISGNHTAQANIGEGGGIYIANARMQVSNNVVSLNSARIGGGIALLDGSTSAIANNTVARNRADGGTEGGGALFVVNSATVNAVVSANIFADNDGYQVFESRTIAAFHSNLFWAASGQLYFNYLSGGLSSASGIDAKLAGLASGTVVSDPGFVNGAGEDYTLVGSSPAVGKGLAAVQGVADYRMRVRSVTSPTIGALESSRVTDALQPVYRFVYVGTGAIHDTASDTDRRAQVSSVMPGAVRYESVDRYVGVAATSFIDVPAEQAFHDDIEWMAGSGISAGYPVAGVAWYRPQVPVTRQAMAAFLYRFANAAFVPPATPSFQDVPTTHPFYAQVEWMAAEGISTGYGSGTVHTFKPNDPVTRQAMAHFLAAIAGVALPSPSVTSFADVALDQPFAPEIAWMKDSGISAGTVQPMGLPLYRPTDAVSRQAMSAFLHRLSKI